VEKQVDRLKGIDVPGQSRGPKIIVSLIEDTKYEFVEIHPIMAKKIN